MSSFTTPLILTPLPDGHHWQLVRGFTYHVGTEYSMDKITVPKGFTTDFASIPRIFWSILPPWGKYGKAAVVHDYLYWEAKRSRKEADDIFLEAMKTLNVNYFYRHLMYKAVRLFGKSAYNKRGKKMS